MKEEPGKKEYLVLITKGCRMSGVHIFRDKHSGEQHELPFGVCCTDGEGHFCSADKAISLAKKLRKDFPDYEYTVYAPLTSEKEKTGS